MKRENQDLTKTMMKKFEHEKEEMQRRATINGAPKNSGDEEVDIITMLENEVNNLRQLL